MECVEKRCLNCGRRILIDDVFCGYCGKNIVELEIQEKEKEERLKNETKAKKIESERKKFAEDIIIECEGNKFKAIKMFKEKFNTSNEESSKYIEDACGLFDTKEKEVTIIEKEVVHTPINYDEQNEKHESFDPDILGMGIKKTIIVGNSSRKKATSAIGRGVVGDALLGPVGMLAGAVTAKSKDKTTFQVIYKNGLQRTVTVKNNSHEFKKYCRYLDN